jgi:predicted lipoprotein with Yx(FWY)xxD motif
VVAAACGGPTYSAASTPGASPAASDPYAAATTPAAATGLTLKVANSKLGQILVDGSGRTVYLWEADKGTGSSCYGACAGAWPPVLAAGQPAAATGVDGKLLSTTTRKDGGVEVDYNGHPLYYFIGDKNPGDTTGQGLDNFGGSWYVLSPAGSKVDNG